jgi:hypothetical protein
MERPSADENSLKLVASATHEALPVRGTLRRENGEPVEVPMPWHFPLLADCSACEKPICKRGAMFGVWEHAE